MIKIANEKIGLSCTPSENLDSEISTCTELVVSLGFGMNSTTETVYGDIISSFEETILFRDITGIETVYTRTFIIKKSEVQLIKVVNDVLKHYQYHGENSDWISATEYLYFAFPQNVEVTFDFSKYIKNPKPIFKFLDIKKD
jgi:hypothetical protein